MRPGRFPGRLLIFAALLCRLPWQWLRRKPKPETVERVLILHQFLLGDALMATSLLAKARERFPKSEIVLACPPGQASLYASRPYGIRPLPWQPRDFASIRRLFVERRFDIVYLMGENRLSFLARAIARAGSSVSLERRRATRTGWWMRRCRMPISRKLGPTPLRA